jgi:hypothetical protein
MRAALLAMLIVSATMQCAAADGFHREDLRIPMAAAAPAVGARAFAALGRTSRIPMLRIHADDDKYFRPDLTHRMHAEFTSAGR